jgi:hypothetical protein
MEMIWDFSQFRYLLLHFLLLSLPFFFVSNAIIITLSYWKAALHKVYFYDLLGAGLGSLVSIAILWFLPLSKVLLGISTIVFFGTLCIAKHFRIKFGIWIALLSLLAIVVINKDFELKPSSYKSLSKALLVPETKVVSKISTPEAAITLVESNKVPFRFVPGLSFFYQGEIPRQLGVFIDGSSFFTMDEVSTDQYYQHIVPFLPYYLKKESSTDILQLGLTGVNRIRLAKKTKLKSLTIVEPNLALVDLLKDSIVASYTKDILNEPKINILVENARSYLASNIKKFTIIDLSLTNFSSDQSSAAILGSYHELYTTEAFKGYHKALNNNGMLSISLWSSTPPIQIARLWNTLKEASFSPQHIIVANSLLTSLILAKKTPFSKTELENIKNFCEKKGFELLFPENIRQQFSSKTNELSNFLIDPVYDDKPFFFHQMKFSNFWSWFIGKKESSFTVFVDSNYFHLWSSLLIALFLCFIFILFPLITQRILRKSSTNPGLLFTFYFSLLGLAFMFTEITLIHYLRQFFSYKVYSIAIVLTIFLSFAGLGSFFAPRWLKKLQKNYLLVFLILAILALTTISVCTMFSSLILGLSLLHKILFLSIFLIPLAFFMGMPFVIGLILSHRNKDHFISWAWGMNGFFSVVGAILAKLFNIHLGFSWTMIIALCLYLLAGLVLFYLQKKDLIGMSNKKI